MWKLLGLLAFAGLGWAQDFGSLHHFNGTIETTERLRFILHSRFRTDNHLSNYAQFRLGPMVNWDWKPRVQLQAGAYYLRQDAGRGTVTQYRPWGGAQLRVLDRMRWKGDWRNLLERHFIVDAPNFTRFRSRGLVTYARDRLQPFASAESLFLQGFVLPRYGAGVNYLWRGHLFGVGYEFRGNPRAPGLHLVTTFLQFRLHGSENAPPTGDPTPPQ